MIILPWLMRYAVLVMLCMLIGFTVVLIKGREWGFALVIGLGLVPLAIGVEILWWT